MITEELANDFKSNREYLEFTRTTAKYPKDTELTYLALGLAGEAGEVAGKVSKVIRDNRGVVTQEHTEKILDEMSDVLWFLTRLCDHYSISLTTLQTINQDKLSGRLARGTIHGSGDSR